MPANYASIGSVLALIYSLTFVVLGQNFVCKMCFMKNGDKKIDF